MATVEEKAADLLRGPIESMGCVLWGIQFLHAGRHSTLRVYIDRDGGVTVDDCAEVSEQIGRLLDVEEVIPYEYRLEVSSPGMDRLFFSFEQPEPAAFMEQAKAEADGPAHPAAGSKATQGTQNRITLQNRPSRYSRLPDLHRKEMHRRSRLL